MNIAKPKVIIIAGPNGAGKSTLAPHLLKDTFGLLEYINADTIALGLSAFSPESVAFEAGRIMLKRLRDLAAIHQTFAFESTLASRFYASWIRELKRAEYEFHLIYLWLRKPELAIQRVNERVQMGGHPVAEPIIRRRYVKGLRNLFKLYRPLADTWAVYDNSVAGSPALVATGKGVVETTVSGASIWQMMKEAAE